MRHARSETFILPNGAPSNAVPDMATRYPDGPVDEHGSLIRRRRDRPDRLDQDMGSGAVAADVKAHPQRRIDSETLLGGERTLVIQHQGEEYTLRLTRLGKLLLTK
jgi:hemin uptake protein HemP